MIHGQRRNNDDRTYFATRPTRRPDCSLFAKKSRGQLFVALFGIGIGRIGNPEVVRRAPCHKSPKAWHNNIIVIRRITYIIIYRNRRSQRSTVRRWS